MSTWPSNYQVTIGSKWKVKDRPSLQIKSDSTAVLIAADISANSVNLLVNPAIGWVGTAQELVDEWEPMPDDTKLTF